MTVFGLKVYFSYFICKLLLYRHRQGRGVSFGSNCLLSYSTNINPSTAWWAQLKEKSHRYTSSSIHIPDLDPLLPYKYFCCCCLLQMWLGSRATEIRHAYRILDVLLYTIYTQDWYIPACSLPVISWCPVGGTHALRQWLHGCFSVHTQEEKATDVLPKLPKPFSF